jgi:hypothetical protein
MQYSISVNTTTYGAITIDIAIGELYVNSPIRLDILDSSGNVVEQIGARSPQDTTNSNYILGFDPSQYVIKTFP